MANSFRTRRSCAFVCAVRVRVRVHLCVGKKTRTQSKGSCPLTETDPVSVLTRGSTDFFDAEYKMLQALVSGEGIEHHMERTCEFFVFRCRACIDAC